MNDLVVGHTIVHPDGSVGWTDGVPPVTIDLSVDDWLALVRLLDAADDLDLPDARHLRGVIL